jgi:hypothetical protein
MSKKADEKLVKKAMEDEEFRQSLINNLTSKEEQPRYESFLALMEVSEKRPELFFSNWEFLVQLLSSKNTYHRSVAIQLLANLTRVDKENKFEQIYDTYFDLLKDKSMVIIGAIARVSGKIAKFKPKLREDITNKLFQLAKTSHEHADLVKSYIIEGFNICFEDIEDKSRIVEFVKKQLNSQSPKTKKMAKEFLKKWEKVN